MSKQEVKLKILREQHKFYLKQASSIYNQLEEFCSKQSSENAQIVEYNKLYDKYETLQSEVLKLKEKIRDLESQIQNHSQNYHCLEKVRTPDRSPSNSQSPQQGKASKFNSIRNSFEKKDINVVLQEQINLIEKMTVIQKDMYNQILLSIESDV